MSTGRALRPTRLIHVVLDRELLDRIDDFRYANRFGSRAEAVRWLLNWALSHAPAPPAPRDRPTASPPSGTAPDAAHRGRRV